MVVTPEKQQKRPTKLRVDFFEKIKLTNLQHDQHRKTERAALFTEHMSWKQPKNPSKDERINSILHTMKYPSTLINKEVLPFAKIQMDFERIMLSKLSQKELYALNFM